MADAGEEEHNFFGNLVTWLTSRFVSVSLPARIRKIWEDLLTTLYVHSTPGEHFGREAVYIFVVGTVPAFLIGSTSAALLFGIVPGFIAGMGLMVAFSQCQKTRSRARRLKVCHMLPNSFHSMEKGVGSCVQSHNVRVSVPGGWHCLHFTILKNLRLCYMSPKLI